MTPDAMRGGIAVMFILLGASVVISAVAPVPGPLVLSGPVLAVLAGVRAYLDGREGSQR
ncbi:hypothetical protein Acsp04_60810 [Actinomadura sp. NBRC 104425]|uniref:hypothetical protein n=1 Tax=Actinomadura sp. NBRC 104425 TaxID=3032204 RepID=UPI0024A53CE3|nr:hypothetical protein [Actinomadura sp. NBRC 104425]GLZ15846.1 hypothetical protein Acsp04_60810 [Actinomadura sp. NBRC 104425]